MRRGLTPKGFPADDQKMLQSVLDAEWAVRENEEKSKALENDQKRRQEEEELRRRRQAWHAAARATAWLAD